MKLKEVLKIKGFGNAFHSQSKFKFAFKVRLKSLFQYKLTQSHKMSHCKNDRTTFTYRRNFRATVDAVLVGNVQTRGILTRQRQTRMVGQLERVPVDARDVVVCVVLRVAEYVQVGGAARVCSC